MRINLVATLWGLAEATLFFIVPDVYLTVIGLYDVRKSLFACLYAVLGAMIGGTIMYYWGMRDVGSALSALDAIPSISTGMLDRVHAFIAETGPWALWRGPLLGVPYKTFAVQSGSIGIGLVPFLLMTVPVRLVRFLILTIVIPFVARRLAKGRLANKQLIVLLAGWAIFYVFYFLAVPN